MLTKPNLKFWREINIKIYNIFQADLFLKNGATAIGAGLGNKYKTYVEFLENEIFKNLMIRWMAHEF